jgi:tetratricopeptide (TPR) repeat protein
LKAEAPSYANPAIAGARVAEKILEAVIAEEQQDPGLAITTLQMAVNAEDSMIYNEPKDWVHPVRQYLGNVFIKAKKYADAARVYREDLQINPNNGWSLTGLYTALSHQPDKHKEAMEVKQKAARAFSKTDAPIIQSVF